MIIPQDYHIHSSFSEDASDPLEVLCRQAIKLGIPEIGFSEHWDVGPYEENPFFFQPDPWFQEIKRLQTLFTGHLIIRAGLEVAEPHLYGKQFQELVTLCQFDYIIGSVHWVGSNFMFDESYFCRNSADGIYELYFSELETMVSLSDVDIVAHFDIPARTGKVIIGYEPTRYGTRIKKILQIIIDRGLTLEINSAGYRKPLLNMMPDPQIVSWYYEMGGRQISLGSDAHQVNQIGMHLDRVIGIIADLGFSSITGFEKRQSFTILLNSKEKNLTKKYMV